MRPMVMSMLKWAFFAVVGLFALATGLVKITSQKMVWSESIDVSAEQPSRVCIQTALKSVGDAEIENTGVDGIYVTPLDRQMGHFSIQSSIIAGKGAIRITLASRSEKVDEGEKRFLRSRINIFASALKEACSR